MGFFTDTDPGFRADTATAMPLPKTLPDASDVVGAAFRESNIVASTIHNIANSGPFQPDPTHNPLDTIRGTKYEQQHLDNFTGSRSEAETRTIMRRIDGEDNDKKILEAAGMGGVLMNMLAGTVDPTILLPGSIAVKSGKAGYEFTRAAINVGAAGALQASVQESVLHATQETRTAGESLMNVASGTVLAGLIGGAASKLLTPAEHMNLVRSLDTARADMDTHANPRPVEPPVPEGYVRLYRGEAPSRNQEGGAYFSTDRSMAGDFGRIKFVDMPKADADFFKMPGMGGAIYNITDYAAGPSKAVWRDKVRFLDEALAEPPQTFAPPLIPEPGKIVLVKDAPGKYNIVDQRGNVLVTADIGIVNINGKKLAQIDDINTPALEKVTNQAEHDAVISASRNALGTGQLREAMRQFLQMHPDVEGFTGNRVSGARNGGVMSPDVVQNITVPIPTVDRASLGVAQSSGAAATDIRTLEMPSSIPGTKNLSVTRRTLEAESVVARRAMADTAETPYSYKQSVEGVAAYQGPPVDRIVKMTKDGTHYEVGQELDRLFTQYRFGQQAPSMARMRAGIDDMLGRSEGKMSYGDFKKQVSEAAMFGDQHAIPEVAEAAQYIRGKVLEPWAARAEAAIEGFKRIEPVAGESYFPHAWNKEKVKARRPEFTDKLTDLYKGDQQTKAAAKERITAYHGALGVAQEQIDKAKSKIASLSEGFDIVQARAEEATRINKFAFQRSEALREGEFKNEGGIRVAVPGKNIEKARGGAVFETKVRDRGNVLQDQMSAKLAEIDALEQRIVRETANHDAMRAKIEDELAKWEGKSTVEAKSALKAREEAVKAREESKAAGTYKGKDERMKSADSAIDGAVKKIIASDRDLSDQELRSIAQQTVDHILGSPDGRLPYDLFNPGAAPPGGGGTPQRGALAHRQLNVTNQWARDWIEDDIEHVVSSHLRTFVPDVVIAERHGDVEMSAVMRAVQEDYARLIDQTKSEKQATKLGNERDAAIRDLAGVRDRIRGVYGWDPGMANLGRITTAVKQVNNITSMGMSAIASLSDFAGAPLRYGITTAFADGWVPFFKNMITANPALEKQRSQLKALGVGVDTTLNLRQHAFDDIVDGYKPQSRVERALQWTSDKFFVANMLAPLTDIQKQIAGNVAINEALRGVKAITEGKATKSQIRNLADAGIDGNMASRIHRQFFENKFGETVDGVHVPNTADWTDAGARQAFEGAITRDVDIMVISPGQEKPLLMSKPIGSLLLQFKSFPAAATERILISNLQRRDAKALSGVITSVALGMLSYKINSLLGGQPVSDDPRQWVKEGISRSGLVGWMEEGNSMAAKLSRGTLDIHRLYGADKPLSRYASRSVADSFLGPTAGKLASIGQVGGAAFSGEWGQSDTTALRRLMFFQNLFFLRQAFNQVEHSANSAFNIPEKATKQ